MTAPPSLPLVQFESRPGLIDLAWGHPDPALLPVAEMRAAAQAALDRWGSEALAYGAAAGAGPLRAWLRDRIAAREGRALTGEEVLITAGVSEGLDQLATLCTQPGDVALVESPTYHLAVRILRDHPLELTAVPADDAGLNVDTLKARLTELRRAGRRPRLLYVVPTFNNPTSLSLSDDRRRALIEVAVDEGFLIVEDDVYRDLAYDGPPPPSLWSLAPAGVVARLGSFSKTVAPGLRLGWLTAAPALVQRLADSGLRDSGGGVNHFTALAVAALCEAGGFETSVGRLQAAYRARRDALLRALAEHLPPGAAWTRPAGGFFVWITLPGGVDAAALLSRAEETGVSYLPGERFHLEGGGRSALRLAFTRYEPDALAEAARRLGGLLRAALKGHE